MRNINRNVKTPGYQKVWLILYRTRSCLPCYDRNPKDPKHCKAETWQTGSIKANEEVEKASASEVKTVQATQQGLESPSATITETPPSPEEQTPQKPLFLAENTPSQNTEKKGRF